MAGSTGVEMMFARTPRLLLRPGWIEDAPALAAAIGEEAIVRNLASAPWPYGLAEARDFLGSWSAAPMSRFLMLQRTVAEPRLIGCIGLDPMPDGRTELGYWIARPFWGLGYATEAGRHMIELARTLGLDRIDAGHFIDNPASGAVLRKLGFKPTGRIVDRSSRARGTMVPMVEYRCFIESPGNDAAPDDGADAPAPLTEKPLAARDGWRRAAA
jgi:RimJ/RimL family protein N-acetyltransferase